ncbi:alpha/beta-hydrolase [Amniculicola lignicola CBS 123094]|uniref:Alpha/beta-hydrolase n=1 Tax=Amniculicola lignicola CBS 123094 TaxID=1392246 RepID=A0A6A5WD82_9PLEO|nr:alpha/beta-hydrolase [Amniculicola lignicola CBS 123094]
MRSVSSVLFAALSLGSLVSAVPHNDNPNGYLHPTNGECKEYTVKESVTSVVLEWGLPKFRDNFDVTAWRFNSSRKDSKETFKPVSGAKPSTGTYTISGTFCAPKHPRLGRESTVLVLSHGLGYDRRYWAPSYKPEKYSFVKYALDEGYSVFYYDRLGTGLSQKLSGYITQASIQQEILGKIVAGVRKGTYTCTTKAKKVILVGHSFGSFISNSLIAAHPTIAEGAILTGLGYPGPNDTTSQASQPYIPGLFGLQIASTLSKSFSDRDSGYLGFGDIYNHIETFFHQPGYEVQAAKYAHSIAQPFAAIEVASLAALKLSAEKFLGHVLVLAGEFDFIICSGECKSTFAEKVWKFIFPAAIRAEGYVHDGAGHGVNFASNAYESFQKIGEFLADI